VHLSFLTLLHLGALCPSGSTFFSEHTHLKNPIVIYIFLKMGKDLAFVAINNKILIAKLPWTLTLCAKYATLFIFGHTRV
jgi:hypothetical protein